MKKTAKRIVAFAMAVVLILGTHTPSVANAASSDARYSGGYTIEDVLTHFQYFTEGDCTLVIHTVGGVAVGKNLNSSNTIGDGSRMPSYANKIIAAQVGNGSDGDYQGTDAGKILYYATVENGVTLQDYHMLQNAGYMDIGSNFSTIQNQSKGLVSQEKLVADEKDIIVCDFINGSNYTIEYEEYKKAKEIRLLVNNISQIQSKQCVINIVGVGSEDIILDGSNGKGEKDTNKVNVWYITPETDTAKALELKNSLTDGRCADGQSNFAGLKLLYNFPDATGNITLITMGGHTVAPYATVIPSGGNLEGGVIAKEIWMSMEADPITGVDRKAEGHFYPYGLTSETPVIVQDVQIIKRYVDPEGNELIPSDNAKFQIYDINNGPVGEVVEVVKGTDGIYRATLSGSGLKLNTIYKLIETPPAGFSISKDSGGVDFNCYVKVMADGSLEYAAGYAWYYGELTFTEELPVIPNAGPSVDDIQLIKSYVKATGEPVMDGQLPNTNAIFTLYSDDACTNAVAGFESVEAKKQDDGSYKVIIDSNMLTIGGTYYLKETSAPDNYKKNQTIYACTIGLDGKITYAVAGTTVNEPVCENVLKEGVQAQDIVIIKKYVDSDGNALPETQMPADTAEFTLYQDAACSEKIDGYESIEAKKDTDGQYKVIVDGDDLLINTTYYLKEKSAPDGYTINSTVYSCVVDENGIITYKENGVDVTGIPVCENVKEAAVTPTGALEVIVREKDTQTPVGNVTVSVKGSNSAETKTLETEENTGKAGLSELPVGKYTVTLDETTLPDKYKLIGNPSQEKEITAEGPNQYIFEVELKKGDLTVTVKDEESKEIIPNADVILVNKESGKKTTVNTGLTGTVTVKDLPVGEYEVKTETVPEGYKKPENPGTVEIKEGESSATVVELPKVISTDSKTGALEVIVTDNRNGNKIAGATVEVKDEKGNKVATGITDNAGQITIQNLPTGMYTVIITEKIGDYTVVTKTERTQEVTANAITTYEYKADKLGALEIVVTDEVTKTVVPNAKVEVKDESGKSVATGITDENGKLTVDKLLTGNYTVTIKEVPTGYTVTTDKEYKKAVEANKITAYEFKVKKEAANSNNNNNNSNTSASTSTPVSANTPNSVVVTSNDATIRAPKTGDTVAVYEMLAMLLFTGVGLGIMLRSRKRR